MEQERLEQENRHYTVLTDFKFKNLENGEWELTEYIGFDEENIEIPGQIGNKRIVALGTKLFAKNKTIKHVKLGCGIKIIGDNAFDCCKSLESVSLPDTLECVGAYAFRATRITDMVFPSSVYQLGKGIFARYNAAELTESTCSKIEKVVLPDGLTEIPDEMFAGCRYLKHINIPKSIKRIGNQAFYLCVGLSTFEFNEGLTIIGKEAFSHAFNVDRWDFHMGKVPGLKFIFPKSLKHINADAFERTAIEAIAFKPGCAVKLDDMSFGDTELGKIYLPKSIKKIGDIFLHYSFYTETSKTPDMWGKYQSRIIGGHSNYAPSKLIVYCDIDSAAMIFARDNGLKCAEYESNFNEFLKEMERIEAE